MKYAISDLMNRNIFKEILKFLKLADNINPNQRGKFAKIILFQKLFDYRFMNLFSTILSYLWMS